MLRYLVYSKKSCIFATVLERNPKHETYFALSPTNRNLVHFNRVAKSNRFRVYESNGCHIWRGALFLFVSVGFTRALFATKKKYSALFC